MELVLFAIIPASDGKGRPEASKADTLTRGQRLWDSVVNLWRAKREAVGVWYPRICPVLGRVVVGRCLLPPIFMPSRVFMTDTSLQPSLSVCLDYCCQNMEEAGCTFDKSINKGENPNTSWRDLELYWGCRLLCDAFPVVVGRESGLLPNKMLCQTSTLPKSLRLPPPQTMGFLILKNLKPGSENSF